MLLDKSDSELDKTIAIAIAMGNRPEIEREPGIPLGRSVGSPMRETYVHHAADNQVCQIAINEVGGARKNRENAHNRLHLGVGHRRKVNQALNGPHTQVHPDLVVLYLAVLR